jgi:hypothetical protein
MVARRVFSNRGYMNKLLILLALFLASCSTAKPVVFPETPGGGWYWSITPPNGPTFNVGPYPSDSECADMLGSAIFSHPWACHLGEGPTNVTCRITGNGFMYPKSYPYPVPASEPIKYQNCFKAYAKPAHGQAAGWYFLFYSTTKGAVVQCSKWKEDQKLANTVPGDQIGYYSDQSCPGWPCFSVGFDTACE